MVTARKPDLPLPVNPGTAEGEGLIGPRPHQIFALPPPLFALKRKIIKVKKRHLLDGMKIEWRISASSLMPTYKEQQIQHWIKYAKSRDRNKPIVSPCSAVPVTEMFAAFWATIKKCAIRWSKIWGKIFWSFQFVQIRLGYFWSFPGTFLQL